MGSMTLLELAPFDSSGATEAYAMDQWLDQLESLSHVIEQRRMTNDQRDRLYGLLERIYADARSRKQPRRSHAA